MMVQSPIAFIKKQSIALMNIESNTATTTATSNTADDTTEASSSSSLPAAVTTSTTTTTSTISTSTQHLNSFLSCGSRRHHPINMEDSHHLSSPPPVPSPLHHQHQHHHHHRSTPTLEYQWIQNVSFPVFILDPIEFVIVAWNAAATRLTRIRIHYQQQQQQQHQHAVLYRSIDTVFCSLDNDDNCRWTDDSPSILVQQQNDSMNQDSTIRSNNNTKKIQTLTTSYPSSSIAQIISQNQQTEPDMDVLRLRRVQLLLPTSMGEEDDEEEIEEEENLSFSSSLLFQLFISRQYNPQSKEVSGFVCMLQKEDDQQQQEEEDDESLLSSTNTNVIRDNQNHSCSTPMEAEAKAHLSLAPIPSSAVVESHVDDEIDDIMPIVETNNSDIYQSLCNGVVHRKYATTSNATWMTATTTTTAATSSPSSLQQQLPRDTTLQQPPLPSQPPAEEYRILIETANAPIFGVDLHGDINEWNIRIADLTGISQQDALGMSILNEDDDDNNKNNNFVLFPVLMQQDMRTVLQDAFQGHGTSNFELEILTHHHCNHHHHHHHHHDSVLESSLQPQMSLEDSNNTMSLFIGNEANCDDVHIDIDIYEKAATAAATGTGTLYSEQEEEEECTSSRFLLVNVSPRRNLQNEIVGAIFFGEDVTEACHHDRAIAVMANELRQLIDTANAPIFGIDRDGDVNEWNDKTAEITGYSKEEAFGFPLIETFIVPEFQGSVHDMLHNALEGIGTSNFEMEFQTKSNEIRHLLVNITPQRDMDDNIVGVVAIAQDVTEAVHRDRAVAGMAFELRQLIDTANAPIFGIDIDGNVNEWNRKTSEITGYSKEEAFDEPLVETFIAPSMQEKVQEILDSALAGNETSNYELEFVSKSGEPKFLLVNATTRRDPENAVVGVVGVAQDVSEDRKHAQALREMQTLRASQEAKVETERNMTAYFAHELRNPLGAIDSALNAMPDDLPESARSLIAGMQLCTGFMSSIMNNLLDVRKMEEGKMQLSRYPISLRKLLHNVHKMLEPSVRQGVEFRKIVNVPKGKSWVLGDAHRIQQVITNVVTNAIKYTVSGYIELVIEWEDEKVKFVCEDTGPGIPKSEQEMLFQRFVQRGGAPGTGLGLAIAKHLVDLTGGSIRFDSDPSVKAGTKCIVLMALPVCEAPDSVVEESTALITDPISFLIIDDIKMNRMMLKRRIKKGIAPHSRIVEAATGEEALEICGKDKFDVIIVDQYMEEAGGVMVGTDVVIAMRRMRIDSVIVGCSGNEMGSQFKDAGADWVWQKPMPSNGKIIQDLRTSLTIREGKIQPKQQQQH